MFNAVREPYAGKLARTVLRGPRFREGARLSSTLVGEAPGDFFNSILLSTALRWMLSNSGSPAVASRAISGWFAAAATFVGRVENR